jgi:hypothetical protein
VDQNQRLLFCHLQLFETLNVSKILIVIVELLFL